MPVYIMRHGDTVFDDAKVSQGWDETGLSGGGYRQVREMLPKLDGLGISRVLASDITRAMQTAHLVAQYLNVPVRLTSRLRPWKVWPGTNEHDLDVLMKQRMLHAPAAPLPEGESFNDLKARAVPFLKRQREPGTLFVTHSNIVSLALSLAANKWRCCDVATLLKVMHVKPASLYALSS